jgi:hypothetical protein
MKDCCEAWSKAQTPGTEDEMYAPVLYALDDGSEPQIGIGLPGVRFCPWCGAATDKEAE